MSTPPSGVARGPPSNTATAPMCMWLLPSSISRKLSSSAESRSKWVYAMRPPHTSGEQETSLPNHAVSRARGSPGHSGVAGIPAAETLGASRVAPDVGRVLGSPDSARSGSCDAVSDYYERVRPLRRWQLASHAGTPTATSNQGASHVRVRLSRHDRGGSRALTAGGIVAARQTLDGNEAVASVAHRLS